MGEGKTVIVLVKELLQLYASLPIKVYVVVTLGDRMKTVETELPIAAGNIV